MRQRVVRCGNGPSQACLARIGRLQVRQKLSQLKRVVGITHRSCPRFFLERGLLGQAAKAEIGQDAPLFERLEALHNRILDLVRGVPQLISAAGLIGKEDSEEDSRLSTPILSKGVPQAHHIGAQCWLEIVDGFVEFCLLYKRSGNVHYPIIARFWGTPFSCL